LRRKFPNRKKPGFPLQVLGFAYAIPVGFPLQSLARAAAKKKSNREVEKVKKESKKTKG
jgi:hypothetical protein